MSSPHFGTTPVNCNPYTKKKKKVPSNSWFSKLIRSHDLFSIYAINLVYYKKKKKTIRFMLCFISAICPPFTTSKYDTTESWLLSQSHPDV